MKFFDNSSFERKKKRLHLNMLRWDILMSLMDFPMKLSKFSIKDLTKQRILIICSWMIFEIIMRVAKDRYRLMTKCIQIWFSNIKRQQLIHLCLRCLLLNKTPELFGERLKTTTDQTSLRKLLRLTMGLMMRKSRRSYKRRSRNIRTRLERNLIE